MGSRQGTINYAIANKKSLKDLQGALSQRGYAPLTERELSSLHNVPMGSDNSLVQLGKNAIGDLGEIAQGLNTLYTQGYQEARRIKQHPQKELSNIKKMATEYANKRGIGGVAEDVANTLLSTYNTKVSDFGKLPAETIVKNVGKGIYENPLFFAMDVAPATKLIPKGAKSVVKNTASKVTRGFIPSESQEIVNKIIKAQKLANEVKTSPSQKILRDLRNSGKVDPKIIARNLITGVEEGGEHNIKATQSFKEVNDALNAELHKSFGLSPEVTKQETISKYILEKLDPDRTKGITVDYVKKEMGKFHNSLPASFDVWKHMDDADELYKQGKLKHISEALRPTTDGIINLDDLERKSFLTQRVKGLTTPEQLGEVLYDTYEFLNKQITKSKSSLDAFNEIAQTLGKKVGLEDVANLSKDEIITSPQALQKALGKSLYGGNADQVSTILKKLANSTLGEDALKAYSNDLYKVDKNLLKGLVNSQVARPHNKLYNILEKGTSLFKAGQLVTPKWFLENRIGNTLLNALEGVGAKEYAKANRLFGKYYKYIPKQLEQSTSYAGYLGDAFSGSKTVEGIRNAGRSFSRNIKEGKPLDAFTSFNQIFSSPIVGLESSFEKVDRWANMIKQAERYAKEMGLDPDKVIKSIRHDDKLFNYLNAKVDDSLGDYLGKNYFINPVIHQLASYAVPFYKFPTQSGRVVAKQLVENPLRSQALMIAPSKKGLQQYQEQGEATGIYPELGGLIRERGRNRFAPSEVERFGANPMSVPFETLWQILSGRGSDVANNLAPIFSDVSKIATFRDKYGNFLSDPNLFNIGNRAVYTDSNGRPTRYTADVDSLPSGTRARLIGSILANRFLVPAVQLNRAGLPITASMMGERYYPNYETTILGQVGNTAVPYLMQGKVNKKGKEGLSELIGQMTGLRTTQEYPQRITASRSELRKAMKKYVLQMRQKEGR